MRFGAASRPHYRSFRISRAALWPGIPVTPPPGWAAALQRWRSDRWIRGKWSMRRRSCASPRSTRSESRSYCPQGRSAMSNPENAQRSFRSLRSISRGPPKSRSWTPSATERAAPSGRGSYFPIRIADFQQVCAARSDSSKIRSRPRATSPPMDSFRVRLDLTIPQQFPGITIREISSSRSERDRIPGTGCERGRERGDICRAPVGRGGA